MIPSGLSPVVEEIQVTSTTSQGTDHGIGFTDKRENWNLLEGCRFCRSLFLEHEHDKGALSVEGDREGKQAAWVCSDGYSQEILGNSVALYLQIWVKVWTLVAIRLYSDLSQREVSAESDCSLAAWQKGDTLD